MRGNSEEGWQRRQARRAARVRRRNYPDKADVRNAGRVIESIASKKGIAVLAVCSAVICCGLNRGGDESPGSGIAVSPSPVESFESDGGVGVIESVAPKPDVSSSSEVQKPETPALAPPPNSNASNVVDALLVNILEGGKTPEGVEVAQVSVPADSTQVPQLEEFQEHNRSVSPEVDPNKVDAATSCYAARDWRMYEADKWQKAVEALHEGEYSKADIACSGIVSLIVQESYSSTTYFYIPKI